MCVCMHLPAQLFPQVHHLHLFISLCVLQFLIDTENHYICSYTVSVYSICCCSSFKKITGYVLLARYCGRPRKFNDKQKDCQSLSHKASNLMGDTENNQTPQ